MLDIIYRISLSLTAALLAVLIVLISVIGCEEIVLTVLGWITFPLMVITAVTFCLRRRKR